MFAGIVSKAHYLKTPPARIRPPRVGASGILSTFLETAASGRRILSRPVSVVSDLVEIAAASGGRIFGHRTSQRPSASAVRVTGPGPRSSVSPQEARDATSSCSRGGMWLACTRPWVRGFGGG